jgi:hypothetical protein
VTTTGRWLVQPRPLRSDLWLKSCPGFPLTQNPICRQSNTSSDLKPDSVFYTSLLRFLGEPPPQRSCDSTRVFCHITCNDSHIYLITKADYQSFVSVFTYSKYLHPSSNRSSTGLLYQVDAYFLSFFLASSSWYTITGSMIVVLFEKTRRTEREELLYLILRFNTRS